MTIDHPEPPACRLQLAAGRHERCPLDERCPFFTPDGCVIAGLNADLDRNPALANLLLDLRTRIMRPGPGWRPFKFIGRHR